MQVLLIIALSVAAAVVYGVLHDQVTARLCIEYFTIGHPPTFQTQSPTLLALGWGVVATWWVGLILGIPLSQAARVGPAPKRNAASLVRPVCVLLLVIAAAALVAGFVGHALARGGMVFLISPMSGRVPRDRHVPFIAALWAHTASYVVGFVGGIVLITRTWRSRRRQLRETSDVLHVRPEPGAPS